MVRNIAKHFGSPAVLCSLLAVFAVADVHGQTIDLGLGIDRYDTTVPRDFPGNVAANRQMSDVAAQRPELCRLPPVAEAENIPVKASEIPQPTVAPTVAKVAQDIPTAVVSEIVNPAAAIGGYVGRWASGGSRENGPKPKIDAVNSAATNK